MSPAFSIHYLSMIMAPQADGQGARLEYAYG